MTVIRAAWRIWLYAKFTAPSWCLVLPAEDLIPTPIDGSVIMLVALVRLVRSGQARRDLMTAITRDNPSWRLS